MYFVIIIQTKYNKHMSNLFKFDTRDNKPKLKQLTCWTIINILVLFLINLLKINNSTLYSSIILTIYFFITSLILFRLFIEQIHYNPYSYNTIYYCGFSIYSLFISIIFITFCIQIINNPDINGTLNILSTILNAPKNYMIFTFPFIFIFSIALCASNMSLLRHEGRSFVNILGIILSILLVFGFSNCIYV